MHTKTMIKHLLKIDRIVIDDVHFEELNEEESLVIFARPFKRDRLRCSHCGKRCQGYDSFRNTRRWRSLDLGSMRVYIEGFSPRVTCAEHGVIVAKVPWARHGSGYTYDFEMAVTWLALHATAKDVAEYFRIEWRMVGAIVSRMQKSLEKGQTSRYDDLEQIGIDETSYKKGHKYMTVVVNHKTGHLIWAHKGHGKEVLEKFFMALTEEQRTTIKYVSADAAGWIAECVKTYCPNAERCVDPFHVVMWATDALDEVRKAAVKAAVAKSDETGKKNRTSGLRSIPF